MRGSPRETVARALARWSVARGSGYWHRLLLEEVLRVDRHAAADVVGAALSRGASLDTMPRDLEPAERLGFEDLAGLFASSSLNHGVVGMTIRQAAYVFGLARRLPALSAIEIGRFRGGSTVVLAAAMGPETRLWSIDIGEKEQRLRAGSSRSYDAQLADFLDANGLSAELLVGDSRTIEVDTGEVDLVFIDGDHSYESALSDFERFGRRVRRGGAVLLDDARDDPMVAAHPGVARAVDEIVSAGDGFRLVRTVDRLAHLERVAASPPDNDV